MQTNVQGYFTDGCGRCSLGGTPDCKVHTWQEPLRILRDALLDCGLVETMKWGVPCYMHHKRNVVLLAAYKAHCGLSFFNGALLQDELGLLTKPGEHTQAGRIMRFTDKKEVQRLLPTIKAYVLEAMAVEEAGLKVVPQANHTPEIPEEFEEKLMAMPELKQAFYALTPGKQRAYLLHFTQAKQAKTRESRILKEIPNILNGKGYNEDWRSKNK